MGNVPATLGLMLPGDDMDTQVERWRALTVDDALARFSIDGETMARALKHTAPSLGDEDPMGHAGPGWRIQGHRHTSKSKADFDLCQSCRDLIDPGTAAAAAAAAATGGFGAGAAPFVLSAPPAPLPDVATCDNRHPLEEFRAKHAGYGCDGCQVSGFAAGTTLHGCRRCDFDICEACTETRPTIEAPAASLLPCRRTTEARGVTFGFLKAYLVRLGMDPNLKASEDPDVVALTSYAMLDRVKADTARFNCSMVEMVDAIHRLATCGGGDPSKSDINDGGDKSGGDVDDDENSCGGWEAADKEEDGDGEALGEDQPLLNDRTKDGRYFTSPVAGRDGRLAPSHFLSYSWAYPLLDICDVIMGEVKTGEDITVWMDIFCINQHQGDKTQEDLGRLRDCIRNVEEVLFVVDVNGTAMTRVWCLYEVMVTLQEKTRLHCVFMGVDRNVYQAAMVALMVLAGRFDTIDVRNSEATVASDKPMIMAQIEENPGTDTMNAAVRAALKDAAKQEFAKTRHAFGSSWWGPDTFPHDVLDGLVAEIQEGGGWQALLKTHIGPHATTQVFDEDAALYKTIFGYINFRTWGMQREPLNWLAMKAKLAELEAAAAHSGGSESD